jgi:hypothetical protein
LTPLHFHPNTFMRRSNGHSAPSSYPPEAARSLLSVILLPPPWSSHWISLSTDGCGREAGSWVPASVAGVALGSAGLNAPTSPTDKTADDGFHARHGMPLRLLFARLARAPERARNPARTIGFDRFSAQGKREAMRR